MLGMVYSGMGQKAQAEAAYRRCVQLAERHLQLHPDDPRALYLGAGSLCQLGDRARSLDWVRRALALEPEDSGVLYNVACVYALQGQTEEALHCLEKAIESGLGQKDWLENDSDLDSVRSHSRFQALLARL